MASMEFMPISRFKNQFNPAGGFPDSLIFLEQHSPILAYALPLRVVKNGLKLKVSGKIRII